MGKIYRCKQAVAFDRPDGTGSVIAAEQVVSSDDPMFKGRQDLFEEGAGLFEPFEDFTARQASSVEQATAEPGEKRSVAKRQQPPTRRGKAADQDKGAGQ